MQFSAIQHIIPAVSEALLFYFCCCSWFFFFKDVGFDCSSWRQSTQNPSWYNIINIQRFSRENDSEVKFSLFTAEIRSYHKGKSAGKRNSANDGSRPSRIPVPKRTKLGPWNELGLSRRRHFNTIKSPCVNIRCQNIFKGACLGYNRATLSAQRVRWMGEPIKYQAPTQTAAVCFSNQTGSIHTKS